MILSQVDGGSFLTLRKQCCILSFHEGGGLDGKLRDLEGKDELGLVLWLEDARVAFLSIFFYFSIIK